MGDTTMAQDNQTRVGRFAARALLTLLDGLRASEVRIADLGDPEVALLAAHYACPIEWPIDVGEPYLDLSEEELLVLVELAEEQEDLCVPPPRPCRAVRRARAIRERRLATTR